MRYSSSSVEGRESIAKSSNKERPNVSLAITLLQESDSDPEEAHILRLSASIQPTPHGHAPSSTKTKHQELATPEMTPWEMPPAWPVKTEATCPGEMRKDVAKDEMQISRIATQRSTSVFTTHLAHEPGKATSLFRTSQVENPQEGMPVLAKSMWPVPKDAACPEAKEAAKKRKRKECADAAASRPMKFQEGKHGRWSATGWNTLMNVKEKMFEYTPALVKAKDDEKFECCGWWMARPPTTEELYDRCLRNEFYELGRVDAHAADRMRRILLRPKTCASKTPTVQSLFDGDTEDEAGGGFISGQAKGKRSIEPFKLLEARAKCKSKKEGRRQAREKKLIRQRCRQQSTRKPKRSTRKRAVARSSDLG